MLTERGSERDSRSPPSGHAALALAATRRSATAPVAGDPAPLTVFDPRAALLRALARGALAVSVARPPRARVINAP